MNEQTNFDCYRLLFGISASPFLYSLRCHRRILAMKTTISIRTHKIAKIWACLNEAHPLTSFLPSIQWRPIHTKMGMPFYTLLYIFTYIKFIPAVRNMLWTRKMHQTLKFCALDKWEKWTTWMKSTHLKGVLIPTRNVCSRMSQFRPRGSSRIKKEKLFMPYSRCYFCCRIPSCVVAKIEF